MHRYVLIPKEQYTSMQEKLIQSDRDNPLKCKTSEIENTHTEKQENIKKQEETQGEDRELLIGGSGKHLPPPGIPKRQKKKPIYPKTNNSKSWKLTWRKL